MLEELAGRVPVRVHGDAHLAVINPAPSRSLGLVCVCTAGTSDIPVAEEAAVTAECSGSRVERVYDVGVAGIHRLLAHARAARAAPTPSSPWPAWRALWPASSAGWSRAR